MTTGCSYLVTGAGRDIGRAIAVRLGGAGSFAILHYSNSAEGVESALAEIRAGGGNGLTIQADFNERDGIAHFIDQMLAALAGRTLDFAVFNAAVTAATPLGSSQLHDLQSMLTANVLAPQRIMDALAAQISDGGAVIALSIAAVRQVFSPDFGFFSATKAAVDTLVRSWAVALGGRGIRVNAVAPGLIDANFRAELLKDAGFRASIERVTALGRSGRIEDVVDVVEFLLSDKARWITGQIIDASGGWKI